MAKRESIILGRESEDKREQVGGEDRRGCMEKRELKRRGKRTEKCTGVEKRDAGGRPIISRAQSVHLCVLIVPHEHRYTKLRLLVDVVFAMFIVNDVVVMYDPASSMVWRSRPCHSFEKKNIILIALIPNDPSLPYGMASK